MRSTDLRLAGFYTQEERGDDGRRVGFEAVGLNNGSTTLASVRSQIRDGLVAIVADRLRAGAAGNGR